MADEEDRSFAPGEAQANRGRTQGLGVGQSEMDQQRDPSRRRQATSPRDPSLGGDMEGATGSDRPSQADFGEAEIEDSGSRDAADSGDAMGDLGEGTPANVDIHKLGQEDNPEEDWGEPAAEGATFSANHTRRAEKTEAERGQGAKTRQHNKDTFSRRT